MRLDYHLHTQFSSDGKSSPEDVLMAARENGLDDICFTDHFECNAVFMPRGAEAWKPLDTKAYTEKLVELRRDYDFGIGIELGQATQNSKAADAALSSFEWDFVLGSLHSIAGGCDFYYYEGFGVSIADALHQYYQELYALAEDNRFSVLSHITYPVKTMLKRGIEFDFKPFYDDIAQILKLVIQNGKGIEVNVSPMFAGTNLTMPDLGLLKLYRSLGGEIITVGSDSHRSATVGKYDTYALELLREADFKNVTAFRKMKPTMAAI